MKPTETGVTKVYFISPFCFKRSPPGYTACTLSLHSATELRRTLLQATRQYHWLLKNVLNRLGCKMVNLGKVSFLKILKCLSKVISASADAEIAKSANLLSSGSS